MNMTGRKVILITTLLTGVLMITSCKSTGGQPYAVQKVS